MKEARDQIIDFIKNNPHIHLRGIKKALGYSMGTIQYHIRRLEREGKIVSKRHMLYKQYIHISDDSNMESVTSFLNLESPRAILIFLLQNEPCYHNDLSQGVGLAPSTVSWHVRKLVDFGVVSVRKNGKYSVYSIRNKETVLSNLKRYKASNWNDIVSNMADLFSAIDKNDEK